MSIKRHLPKSLSNGHQREIFQSRNLPILPTASPRKISKGDKISRSLESCFVEDEKQGPFLRDEIPSETVSFLVGESRSLLSSSSITKANWDALSEFLTAEMGDFVAIKQQMNAAQRDCANLLKVAEEVCDPASNAGPNRVLEVALALQEAKMRRDNLRARVELVIDELSAEILAGISLAEHDSLEIRLRGVLGKLG